MIKAVLLDLDETLLEPDRGQLSGYCLKLLADSIQQRNPKSGASPEKLNRASQRIVESLDPTLTVKQKFVRIMAGQFDISEDEAHSVLDDFFSGEFYRFPGGVHAEQNADRLLHRLFDMGLAVVIATTPLFPRDGILQRLAWAGLDASLPYTFITSQDDVHFSKNTPHYYEEILARVGVEADEAIMIGNHIDNDMSPASQAGLNTFWIGDGSLTTLTVNGSGTLAEVDQKVADGWLNGLTAPAHTAEQVIPRMVGNTAAAFGMVDAINPAYWDMRPDPNEWSPLETVCHLRDSEREVQRPRLQRIAAEDNPFISSPTAPPGPGARDLSAEEGLPALQTFWQERCQTISFLSQLSVKDWLRPARHSIFGPTTLLEMAHFTARHDRLHLNQLCQTIGRCRAE